MKRLGWFGWLMIGLLAGASQAYSSSTDSISFRVMTFNIRYDNPQDGIYSWNQRKDLVLTALDRENPDIIGFQEALVNQVTGLADSLPDYAWFGVGRDDGKQAGEYAPVFYRRNHFTPLDSGFFWLSETPELPGSISWGAACTRIVTWMKLQENSSGIKFYVFNTHFDHISEEARVNSATLLLSEIKDIAGDKAVLLMGDFNCTPRDQAFRILSDRFQVTGPSENDLPEVCTFIGFPPSDSPGEVIDFIFIRPFTKIRSAGYKIVIFHRDGRFPSDHLPVESDLVIW
ncbi:MAG: endonuclease/exonuclease/phosphatase family protein [Bacteroidales bacterium]|nr:endonuclease/exonuclease/phosphatase family protein [Bacteroidales bacterium]